MTPDAPESQPRRSSADEPPPFPPDPVGGGLQHERTALAWERTAIAMMVAGAILARNGASTLHLTFGLVGVAQVVGGGLLLAWAGRNDDRLHNPATPASAVPQVGLTRVVGLSSLFFCGAALALAVISAR